MREIQSGSLNVLPGGSISVAMFSIAGMLPTMRAALRRLRAALSTDSSVRGGAAR
jgi:hypothetical protein